METGWVSASELGDWAYCRRAWWYARQGAEHAAGPRLAAGAADHAAIARDVARLERQRTLGVRLSVSALVLTLLLIGVLVALR
jgi:hypothetical protein